MSVQLTSGGKGFFPLTSPPAEPDPIPDDNLIAKIVEYPDRKVWVTIPFPDTIELIAPIKNEYLTNPDKSNKSVKTVCKQLDYEIKGMLKEWSLGDDEGFVTKLSNSNGPKATTKFAIRYNPAEPLEKAFVTFSRAQTTDYGDWKLRLEFSPRKAGKAGMDRIAKAFFEIADWLSFPALLKAFEVSRVDSAVDCIGVEPLDLIAHAPKAGKRMVYSSDRGRPETIYIFERKKALTEPPKRLGTKTTGVQRLTLYERRDYHKQFKLKPPHGHCPVTRAEVVIRWKANRPMLADLSTIANQFKGRRVAYAAAVDIPPTRRKIWKHFCMEALGVGMEMASYAWVMKGGFSLAKQYENCVGDLVSEECWDRWGDGLAYTGLKDWIEAAKSHADPNG